MLKSKLFSTNHKYDVSQVEFIQSLEQERDAWLEQNPDITVVDYKIALSNALIESELIETLTLMVVYTDAA